MATSGQPTSVIAAEAPPAAAPVDAPVAVAPEAAAAADAQARPDAAPADMEPAMQPDPAAEAMPLDLEALTAELVPVFRAGRQQEALDMALAFTNAARDRLGLAHPTYINALATVAALVDQMGGSEEADALLYQAEGLRKAVEDAAQPGAGGESAPLPAGSEEDNSEESYSEDEWADASMEGASEGDVEGDLGSDGGVDPDEDGEEAEAQAITHLTWEVNALLQKGQPEQAAQLLGQAEKVLFDYSDLSHVNGVTRAALHTLWAAVLDAVGEPEKAKALYQEALDCLENEAVGMSSSGSSTDEDDEGGESSSEEPSDHGGPEEEEAPAQAQAAQAQAAPEPAAEGEDAGLGRPAAPPTPEGQRSEAPEQQQPSQPPLPAAPVPEGAAAERGATASSGGGAEASPAGGGAGAFFLTTEDPADEAPPVVSPSPRRAQQEPPASATSSSSAPAAAAIDSSPPTPSSPSKPKAPPAKAGSRTGRRPVPLAPQQPKAAGANPAASPQVKAPVRVGGGVAAVAPPPKAKAPGRKPLAPARRAKAKVQPSSTSGSLDPGGQDGEEEPEEAEAPSSKAQEQEGVGEAAPREQRPVEEQQAELEGAMTSADHFLGLMNIERAAEKLEEHLVLLADDSSALKGSDTHVEMLAKYGSVLWWDGDLEGAVDALAAADEILGERPSQDAQVRMRRTDVWGQLAQVQRARGQLDEADRHLSNAVNSLTELVDAGEADGVVHCVEALREAQASLGQVCVQKEDYERAEKLYLAAFSRAPEGGREAASEGAKEGASAEADS